MRVLAWLGESTEGSDELIDEIRAKFPKALNIRQRSSWSRVIYDKFVDIFSEQSMRKHLEGLINRDYWFRTWIWQEVALAKEARFLCGDKYITLPELDACIRHVREPMTKSSAKQNAHGSNEGTVDYSITRTVGYFHASTLFALATSNQALTLDLLIMRMYPTECLDIRDRVFGILGLARDLRSASPFKPDYSLSAPELVFSVLDYCNQPQDMVFAFTLMQRLKVSKSQVLLHQDARPTISFPDLRCFTLQTQLNGLSKPTEASGAPWPKTTSFRENWLFLASDARLNQYSLRKSRKRLEYFAEVTNEMVVSPCDVVLCVGRQKISLATPKASPPGGPPIYFLGFETCRDKSMRCKFKYLALHDAPMQDIDNILNDLMPLFGGCELYLDSKNTSKVHRFELGLELYHDLTMFNKSVKNGF